MRILIVEDDPMLVKMYKSKFESAGIEVESAHDGEEGLNKIIERKPDLVILDIMIPKMSGLEVLSSMMKNPNIAKIPVIVLSNLTHELEAKKALSLGAKEYLVKAELTPSQVAAKVRQYLQ